MPQETRSQKTTIIEQLFDRRWNETSQELSDEFVTLEQVTQAIADFNAQNPRRTMSARNPANFYKDFIRKLCFN